MFYVQYDENHNIQFASESPHPDFIPVDFDVVCGIDGKLYRKGEEPVASGVDWQRRHEILAELDRVDRASSRPLRAILAAQSAGQEPDAADVERLAGYEASAKALRAELAELEA